MGSGWRKRLEALRAVTGLGGAPKNRSARSKASVAGDVARLRTVGARLGDLPRPSWRSVGIAVAVGLLAAGAVAGLRHRGAALEVVREHPYFHVDRIEIRGTRSLVSETELRAWLGVREGDSLWDSTPEDLASRLASHPMLSTATVRREFPGTLDIQVEERRPAAIVVTDGLYYLDDEGRSFGPLGPKHGRDYPVFTGVAEGADGQRRWALRRALNLLERGGAGAMEIEVSELHLDRQDGLILYPAEPRVPIYLGWRAWERRLARAERVLADWGKSPDRLARVDLRFRDQVVVRLRAPRNMNLGGSVDGKVST